MVDSGDAGTSARAAYRPVRTVLAFRGGDSEGDRGAVAAFAGAPNAVLGTAAYPRAGAAAGGRDDGTWLLFDRDGAFLGTMDDAGFAAAWEPCAHDPRVHHAPAGEPFEMEADATGLRHADGTPVTDVAAAWRGLARLDADGCFLVEADAPLAVQAAALCAFEGEEGEDASCAAHLLHVAHAARILGGGPMSPGAWLDVELLADVVEASRDGLATSAAEAAGEGLARLSAFDRSEPCWTVGPPMAVPPREWMSRATPGSGALWALIDVRLSRFGPGATPGPRAQCALSEAPRPRWNGLASYLRGCEVLAAGDGDLVVRHRRDGMVVALTVQAGLSATLAWDPSDRGPRGRDPLMAERLLDVAADVDGIGGEPDTATAGVRESLMGLNLLAVLPEPPLFPGYAALAIERAHQDGATLPDLCASLAQASGAAGVRAASERAGGVPHGLLTALVAGAGREALSGLDLGREARLLLDAARRGATLRDLSLAATVRDDGPET